VTFELFSDITPQTTENFRALCTGEKGLGPTTRAKLHYLGTKVHRVVDGFVLQGGDITKGDGTGGDSIFPDRYFKDENFVRRHAHAGLLSMANCGANTNASQFFVTLKECPHLDGKHVVFGQVVEGMQTIRDIAKVPTDMYEKPKIPVHIVDCG
jgi:peptidyl-prolyl isomerase G (cyclophilin G)